MADGLNVKNTDGYAISGYSTADTGVGVRGDSLHWYGVQGFSPSHPGVLGASNTDAGVAGSSDSAGVAGHSTDGAGVLANSINGAGVLANSINYIGVLGIGKLGGVFGGGLINWGGPKSTAVRSRDGSHRLLYCVESPESWFEDFGRARLVRGKAEVRLDAAFAAAVRTDDYHIFLSPEGNCAGLYVSRRSRAGFQVREQGHGTSTVAFSYRIVARRKDIEAPRFAKLPKHLDPSHLKKTLKAFKPPKRLKLPEAPRVPAPPHAPSLPKQRGSARGRGAHSKRMRGSTTA